MNKLKKQIFSVLATGSLLLNVVAPVAAGTTIEISGNGSDSDNTVTVQTSQSTTVTQVNSADVFNKVDADADTGDNTANKNTGGDVTIETGDATTEVNVENTLNSNSASVDCCGAQDVDVLISGNGSESKNDVDLKDKGTGTVVWQDNKAEVKNIVDADSDTGENKAKKNTGGDVSIETGDAETTVNVSTTANANWAQVGGSGSTPTLSMRILGNGEKSKNSIKLELDGGVVLTQTNAADVFNKVDADADTGDNTAKENTGGAVSIETGDAETTVDVDNMVNFNWADVDCGCLFDVLAKVAGNGSDSDNKIDAKLGGDTTIWQTNCVDDHGKPLKECELDNFVDADADTGENKAKKNTGDPGDDPSIETGDADTTVDVSNTGNSNVFGGETPSDWPEFEFNFNLSLSWEQLLALLGL